MKVERIKAPFVWYGGKGSMIKKLLPLVPPGGEPYAEPFCGAASIFFARDPAPVEAINDINKDIVNLFRVLQNKETFEQLRHWLAYTPYSRDEIKRAIEIYNQKIDDPVTKAWAFLVRINQSMSGKPATCPGDWGRVLGRSSQNVSRWQMRIHMIDAICWRLQQAQIDNIDALKFIKYWDTPQAVFYVDPPYVPETRKQGHTDVYSNEMSRDDHRALTDVLLQCQGAVVLSGYRDHEIHSPLEKSGWSRVDFNVTCSAAGRIRGSKLRGNGAVTNQQKRVESVWINPKALSMLPKEIRKRIKETQNDQKNNDQTEQLMLFQRFHA